jgi:hypothetical protein
MAVGADEFALSNLVIYLLTILLVLIETRHGRDSFYLRPANVIEVHAFKSEHPTTVETRDASVLFFYLAAQ